jgi:pyruvate-formate lyase-activating enzyme
MRSTTLRISRSCNNTCPFCEVKATLDGRPVPAASIRAALDAAAQRCVERVVFSGGEPTLSGQVTGALSYAKGLGLRTALATNGRLIGDEERAGRVYAAGLDEVLLALHSTDPERHRLLTGGDVLAHRQAIAALAFATGRVALTVRTVLTRLNLGDLPDLIRLSAQHGALFEVRRVRRRGEAASRWDELGLSEDEALNALDEALRVAAALGVPMRFVAFGGGPASGAAQQDRPVDLIDARLFDAGILTPAMRGGLRKPEAALAANLAAARKLDEASLPLLWASQGAPWRDAPAEAGGGGATARTPFAAAAAGGPIAVIAAPPEDPWPSLSTLPGLVHELRARGADATLHTPYDAPFDPATLTPPAAAGLARLGAGLRSLVRGPTAPLAHPERLDPADPAVRAAWDRFLGGLDLSKASLVVTADAATAARLRASGVNARIVTLEEALLDGLALPTADGDVLRTPFWHHLNLYLASGVDPAHLHPRPVSVFTPHLAGEAAERCSELVILGGELVDPALKAHGALLTPSRRPAEGWAAVAQRLRTARAVILPWRGDLPPTALRWLSLAIAAGRPIVAPAIPVVRDHVRHGINGLLTPVGDAVAFADAVASLRDDARVATLAAGAKRSAAPLSTASWAAELVQGAPAARGARDEAGVWRPW